MQEGLIRAGNAKMYSADAQSNGLLGNAPQQPLSAKISGALDLARATLDQLSAVADRSLGSYPTPVSNYSDTTATYVSTVRQVDDLTDVLHQIASVSQRLSSGL